MNSRLAAERQRILKRDPLSVADPSDGTHSPSNVELQTRLASAVHDFARRASIGLDRSAHDYLGTLIRRTSERLSREGLLQPPHAVQQAEAALVRLLRQTAAESRNGTIQPPGVVITSASIKRTLAGICPLWPVC